MATLAITINVTMPDREDVRAMNLAIAIENTKRSVSNPVLPPLPNSTPAERKTSYEVSLTASAVATHKQNIEQVLSQTGLTAEFRDLRGPFLEATPAKRAAALAALA